MFLVLLPGAREAERWTRAGVWNENTDTAPEWRWPVGQSGVGKYAYGIDAPSGRRFKQSIMMMTIQSIWLLVAIAICAAVGLALGLTVWLLGRDPANK